MTVHESFHRLAKLYKGITAEQLQAWYGGESISLDDYNWKRHLIRRGVRGIWRTESELRAEIAAAEKPTWQQQVVDALKADRHPWLPYVLKDDSTSVYTTEMEIVDDGRIINKSVGARFDELVKRHDKLVDALNAAGLDQYKRIVPKFMPTVEGDAIRFENPDTGVEYNHYKTGLEHRLDGPAFISPYGLKHYYVYGEYYKQDDYAEAVAKYKEAHGV